jgi:hypothetical protein
VTARKVHAEARSSPQSPVIKQCPTCGRDFKVHVCTLKRGSGKYCSIKCRPYAGAGNPKWRGGRIKDGSKRTMVYAPGDPNATMMGGKYAYEYRLVAAQKLGRPLRSDEIVHHINGDSNDNRPENLEVMSQSEHIKAHGLPLRKRSA